MNKKIIIMAAVSIFTVGSFSSAPAFACKHASCSVTKCKDKMHHHAKKRCCKNKTCYKDGGCKSNAKKKPCSKSSHIKPKCKGKAKTDHSDNRRYND